MSSGFKIDPSSPSSLDHGRSNDENLNGGDSENDTQHVNQKPYIDRSNTNAGENKSLDSRKTRKKKTEEKEKDNGKKYPEV